jgi:hypothetical protein
MRWDNDLVRADGVPFTYSGAQQGAMETESGAP